MTHRLTHRAKASAQEVAEQSGFEALGRGVPDWFRTGNLLIHSQARDTDSPEPHETQHVVSCSMMR